MSRAAVAAEPEPAAAVPGEEIYNTVCMVCHAAGLAGAPKLGDIENWAPRIAQGMEILTDHVIKRSVGKVLVGNDA